VTGVLYAIGKMGVMLTLLKQSDLQNILLGAGATFLRIEFTLVLAALWTIPVGVFIGLRPRLSAIAQPIAQIAASVSAAGPMMIN
jgi:NitT/TauT family transport system permease protein